MNEHLYTQVSSTVDPNTTHTTHSHTTGAGGLQTQILEEFDALRWDAFIITYCWYEGTGCYRHLAPISSGWMRRWDGRFFVVIFFGHKHLVGTRFFFAQKISLGQPGSFFRRFVVRVKVVMIWRVREIEKPTQFFCLLSTVSDRWWSDSCVTLDVWNTTNHGSSTKSMQDFTHQQQCSWFFTFCFLLTFFSFLWRLQEWFFVNYNFLKFVTWIRLPLQRFLFPSIEWTRSIFCEEHFAIWEGFWGCNSVSLGKPKTNFSALNLEISNPT